MAFIGELGLRSAEAAEGAEGDAVGEHGPAVDADIFAVIGAGGVDKPAAEDDGGEGGIGAAIHDDFYVAGDDSAVVVEAGAVVDLAGVAFGGGFDVFIAVVDYFYGAFGFEGEEGAVEGEEGGIVFLAAEAAAGGGLDDAELIFGAAEGVGEGVEDIVGALHGAGDDEDAFFIEPCGHGLGFEVDVFLAAGGVGSFDDVVGAFEGGVDVAFFDGDLCEDVLSMWCWII